ncbi:hypothetical protein [Shouchella lonarensis]|uniref:Uncharacterized protein n=1 Tax=Shouchella lonarensis TaxID=1464122 RepID=A0A1G6HJ25_9BACI|nr:hypothetical protein [Shouchella lonarensis]SDB94269.1 hypothetical protein SAMN05421737_1049 [Shouchella lonarensis]
MKTKMIKMWVVCGLYMVLMGIVAIYYAMDGSGDKVLIALSGVISGLMPPLLGWLARFYLPLWLVIFYLAFVFGSQYLGPIMEWYDLIGWWDKWLHFMSGVLLPIVAFYLYKYFTHRSGGVSIAPFFVCLFVLSFGALGAVIWEVFEFVCDEWFDMTLQDDNFDTMVDLIFNMFGSLIIAVWVWVKLRCER